MPARTFPPELVSEAAALGALPSFSDVFAEMILAGMNLEEAVEQTQSECEGGLVDRIADALASLPVVGWGFGVYNELTEPNEAAQAGCSAAIQAANEFLTERFNPFLEAAILPNGDLGVFDAARALGLLRAALNIRRALQGLPELVEESTTAQAVVNAVGETARDIKEAAENAGAGFSVGVGAGLLVAIALLLLLR